MTQVPRPIFDTDSRTVFRFEGPYFFLSNFAITAISYDGVVWKSAEHLFQAMKTPSFHEAERIWRAESPAEAKRIGREVELRDNWDLVKKQYMLEVLMKKFTQNHLLRGELCALKGWNLIEGNEWGDQYWGVTYAASNWSFPTRGMNCLGRLLMAVRDVLIED